MRTSRTITQLICLATALATAPLFGATPGGVGLHGDYYEAVNLSGSIDAVRTDGPINFEWRSSGPGGGIDSNRFSIRWTGFVEAPVTGSYTFATWSDDGVRLWVNGTKLIDNWTQHSPMRNAGAPVTLTAGQRYEIKLEYYENTGRSEIKLLWTYPGQKEHVTPQKYLYPPANVTYLSDLAYKEMANGWGPAEKDLSNGETKAGDGKPLSVGGRRFAKGLGVHASSDIRLALDGSFTTFAAWVGIDDEVSPGHGSAVFQVWLDGEKAYESRTLRGISSARFLSVPLKNAKQLRLVVNPGSDGIGYDHADWADAQLLKTGNATPTTTPNPTPTPTPTPTKPAAPTGLNLISGDSQIMVKWSEVAGATGYNVYRGMSAGGEEPTPVAVMKTTSFANTGLTNGKTYFYKVAAINAVGTGPLSSEGSAMPKPGLPTAPANLTAAPGDKAITLKWNEVAGAAGYNVYRGTASGGQSSTPIAKDLKTNTFASTGLTNGTKYYFRVAATNMTGLGAMSNEASGTPKSALPPAPTGLTGTPGNELITLKWNEVTGATGYNVYRGTASGGQSATPIATDVKALTFASNGLANGTKYYFKVAALNAAGLGAMSNEASGTPKPELPPAPANLTSAPADKSITLTWDVTPGATGYSIFRATTAGGQSTSAVAKVTTNSFTNTGLTNGTTYFFKVAATNMTGAGPMSGEVSNTPKLPPPVAPASLTATPGDALITLTWTAVPGVTSYSLYRGMAPGAEAATPIATNLKTTTYNNINLVNGTAYFYKLAAVNAAGPGAMSNEATTTPVAPGPVLTPAQISAFRFLRQASWGPTQASIDQVVQMGPAAWIDQQIATPASPYEEDLITKPNMELVQEKFFQNALVGPDQLRQRVAFALSQIWVVSAVKVDETAAFVPYLRILENGAFGNFHTLMRELTLSPASGEFLDMINNTKADPAKGTAPNENFGRELMQLYTLGLIGLNPDGTPKLDPVSQLPIPSYDQDTVVNVARALTGWTYTDGNATPNTRLNPRKYTGPMEPVEKYHDTGEKIIFGQTLAANQTATQDLDQTLAIIFAHPNLPPFISKQLIQRLVTSNPSPKYIGDVAAVFADNGKGARGDLGAVVKAILLHPEAALGTPTSGKLDEPALFITSMVRALGATVADHPFMSDLSADMGQRVLFAPSVFNYFSPSFRVPGSALLGPEFQILNTATAMTRANFVKSLITGGFGSDVVFDWAPFTALATTPGALVDKAAAVLMGGTMSTQMRQAILAAVNASPSATEKARTAVYLTAISMQYQVAH